jgi:hypothetical protein
VVHRRNEPLRHHAEFTGSIVDSASGDVDARALVESDLEWMATNPDWARLADNVRRILAGARDPALAEGLDVIGAATVTAVLEQLNLATEPPQPRTEPHGHKQA